MSKFNLRILFENEPLIKAKAERISDFEPLFEQLKKKFGDERKKKDD